MDDFVHAHAHSDASAFDGVGRPGELAAKCAAMGQPGWALTDHGSLRGVWEAAKASRKHGVKFVPGVEAYLADDATQRSLTAEEKEAVRKLIADPLRRAEAVARGLLDYEDFDPKDPDTPVPTDVVREALRRANAVRKERDHITLWAMNDIGLRNLYRLNAWAWSSDGGHFYKPRLDMNMLSKHAEGIAASTGCPGGVITSPVRRGALYEAKSRMDRLAGIFGDRLYVELMPHVPEKDCVHLPKKMLWLAQEYGAKAIVTQDAHYPHEEDVPAQDALLCTHTKAKIHDPERFKFDAPQYWMKTREEMNAAFEEKRALTGLTPAEAAAGMDETLAFLDRCSAEVEEPEVAKYMALPTLPSGWGSHREYLQHLCKIGVKNRNLLWSDRYKKRLELEFKEFDRLEAIGRQVCAYFVTAWDLRRWCRENGIMGGPGRGSGAGSLTCFLLQITDLDPLVHELTFERFMSPGRQDMPDLDLDVPGRRREEVIGYLRETYGKEHVAHIANHNRLGGKSTLRDLCRIFEIPSVDAEPLAALIQSGPQSAEDKSDEGELYSALIETETGRQFATDYPDAAAVAQRLEGNMRSTGVHAGGIVISSVPLADIVPVESVQRSGLEKRSAMVAYDMGATEEAGLVKLDVLGLQTLDMLELAFSRSGSSPADVDLEDPEALEVFTQGRTAGIFQFDTNSARRASRGVLFRSFETVAAITALNRPGPLKTGLADDFVTRSNGDAETPSIHPIYDEVFARTFGVPVYQEQLVTLVQKLSGYTPVEADAFRKKVSKKRGVSDEEEHFVSGAVSNGMSPDDALGLFNDLVGFGQYCFNKCLGSRTLVATPLGHKPISDLEAGDWVFSSSGPRRVVSSCVAAKTGYTIHTEDGDSVTASAEHRFFRPDGSEVRVDDLKVGDEIGKANQRAATRARKGAEDLFRGVVPDSRTLRERGEAALQHPPSAHKAVWPHSAPRRAHLLEQGEDEGGHSLDRGDGGSSNGGEELEVQGRPHSSHRRDARSGVLLEVRSGAGRHSPQERGPGGQPSGEPGRGVPLMPSEGPLLGAGPESEGRRWRPRGPESVEYGPHEGDGAGPGEAGGRQDWPEARERHHALAPSRIVRIDLVEGGPIEMVDIGVEHPNDFFLANGLLSHNSHSCTYAALALWCAWLKVRFPAHFYAAALEVKKDEIVKMRLAAEARRMGIPVSPPNINHPHAGFKAIKTPEGTWEILGGISDVHNVGPVASQAVASAAPFSSLLDLRLRVGKGFTAQQFKALAHATALRDLFPNTRFLAKNAKLIWGLLGKGTTPELKTDVRQDTPDEEAVRVGQVWPLFLGMSGRTAFDVATEAVAKQLKGWRVTNPGDDVIKFTEGAFLVVGRAVKFKLFGEGSSRNGRVILASADGEELPCRVDGDVADACPLALSNERGLALALVNVKPPYRPSVEAIWPVSPEGEIGHGPGRDYLLEPPHMRPADPGRPAVKLEPGRNFLVRGLVLRRKFHLDRNKNEMLTFGILGPKGYVRSVAFSSRLMSSDDIFDVMELGAIVKLRLNKGERGTHLADTKIELVELEEPPSGRESI
ncbi:MAG: DNA polymerase III subunit alpha [Actinomycetales bacterium]|nr:DNA polymerase III subunit alpha [Actinomycetales bacterium]